MSERLFCLVSFIIFTNNILCSTNYTPSDTVIYKTTAKRDLALYIFYPSNKDAQEKTAIIHFFGGGWVGGTPSQFYQQCEYLASEGYVAITADYRVMKTDGITPFECVEDARAAIRYVRQNARKLGISPDRIVASGGSAGGHIALCTAVFSSVEEEVSSVPNGLILYNPVLDTTENGYGTNKFSGNELLLSPNHHIHAGIPPTLILHGTDDKTVPFANARDFSELMATHGNDCYLVPFKGKDHGFFNGSFFRKRNGDVDFLRCMENIKKFLKRDNIF